MSFWTVEKKIESADGKRYIVFRVSPDGQFYRYGECTWTDVSEDKRGFRPEGGYWLC